MKKCKKCLIELDLSCFAINNSMKDGLASSCKKCLNEYSRNRRNDNEGIAKRMERRRLLKEGVPDGFKRCSICEEVKPTDDFYFNHKGPYSYCKPCAKKKRQEWDNKNIDKRRELTRLWYRTNSDYISSKHKEYRKLNKESIKESRRSSYLNNRQNHLARANVTYHLKMGGIIKPSHCEKCDNPKVEAHHHMGYDRENWLNVQWLCKKHHMELHRKYE